MWKWFKEEVLGIKPIFKIKIETSWFSKVWFCVKFSNNNGWTWTYLLTDDWKIPSPYSEKETAIKYFQADNLEYIKEQFKTYDDCIKYNQNVEKSIKDYNQKKKEAYYKNVNSSQKFMNEFNSAH